ncbi:hypothetical protein ACIBG8_28945 [Nonomuraea sp. NPDC050556]|uniref:hypothetical protein n=1 Tax=Nonomuraea sp. NPDC050556 TaxID=3364369 RepID=UPI0037A7F292
MNVDTEFHGPHIAEPDMPVRVNWFEPIARCQRVRVSRHTCECLPVHFELCRAAGLGFVRRIIRRPGKTVVQETDWMRVPEAEQLWALLLKGRAV